jgi:UDP-3-O-[3-hydroxymyristoyl] glucosamine N-acyltransferase
MRSSIGRMVCADAKALCCPGTARIRLGGRSGRATSCTKETAPEPLAGLQLAATGQPCLARVEMMQHPGFFKRSGPFSANEIASHLGGECRGDGDRQIHDIKTLQSAGPQDVSFLSNRRYQRELATTRAGACLVEPALVDRVPAATTAIVVDQAYHAFAGLLTMLYPGSDNSLVYGDGSDGPVAASAEIEEGAIIEPGAIVAPEARIGSGTRICSGAVIGYRCTVGRDCYIGSRVTLIHTLLGNRVRIHPGASIGQDGFGFAMGPGGHRKVPQIGRVIVQDDVEIGANTTIDRGALNDTIVGEGTKIDNLVQIGHNVIIGRHCVIVSLSGLAGSTELGDFVVMAGKTGTSGHLKIGDGAQLAGMCHVNSDVPPGARMGGTPGRPFRQWLREQAAVRRLAKNEGDSAS